MYLTGQTVYITVLQTILWNILNLGEESHQRHSHLLLLYCIGLCDDKLTSDMLHFFPITYFVYLSTKCVGQAGTERLSCATASVAA